MKHLIIIGVGGFAREVYWYAQDSRGYRVTWDLKGFLDGDVRLDEEEYRKLELPVLGDVKSYEIQEDDVFACAVGTPKVKERLVGIMEARGGNFINIIHNMAIIQGNVTMGKGIILCPWVSLNDHSKIGNHVMFGAHGGMAHDSSVGDYSCFMGGAGLCGNVQVGKGTYWGDGATALPHSVIGDYAYIGCRSVVYKKVKVGQKVLGNPALPI